jgi:hypothetical protein
MTFPRDDEIPAPDIDLPPIETLTYVSADGQAVDLVVTRGATGRLMPPVDIWEDIVPLVDGSRYRGSRHAARDVILPIVTGGVRFGRAELRRLASVLDPARGMGALRSNPGGRELSCVYRAGLESLSEDFPHWSRANLLFRATDPFWHDGVYQVRDFVPSEIVTEWFPIFPLSISPTNVFGEFSVNNNGDADAWPEVDVHGPGDDFRFTNMTTSRFLAITGNIPAGGVLRVTTEPGNRGVALGNDNWFSRLERGSSLWQLVPGFNTLRVQFRTEASRVAIRWRLRYLAP